MASTMVREERKVVRKRLFSYIFDYHNLGVLLADVRDVESGERGKAPRRRQRNYGPYDGCEKTI